MFQICNLQNHIYTGRKGDQRYLEGEVAVLDYDDFTIEIVDSNLLTRSILNQCVAIKRTEQIVYLPRCNELPSNDLLYWKLHRKSNIVRLFLHKLRHDIDIVTRERTLSGVVIQKLGVLRYDGIRLLDFVYRDDLPFELYVNYAFMHGECLIMRLTVAMNTIHISQIKFSLVFLGDKLLGCYVTYAANDYKIYNSLSPELESKLLFFLKDKY